MSERTAISTEPIPWDARISSYDMAILIASRLPINPTRRDVLRRFSCATDSGDVIQLTVRVKREWWRLSVKHWVVTFHFDAGEYVDGIGTARRSDF
jgi:hypothetical protein